MPQPAGPARLTVITLGVGDMRRAIRFYEALGFARKFAATGEEVAFFVTGASVLALYPWDKLALDATLPDLPRPVTFRGVTLAWNCASNEEVDRVLAHAQACGAQLIKPAHKTDYGGYSGYFSDPDGHAWEVVTVARLVVEPDGRLSLPD